LPSEIGHRLAVFSISWILLFPVWAGSPESRADNFSVSWIEVVADGAAHRFTVEVARTPDERAQGLQHRENLPADHGMLFDFGSEGAVAMWMRNTPIPLDMLFVTAAGEIAGIAERTEPYSLATIASPAAVRYVLEVAGGTADRLGIAPGDRLRGPPLHTD
jgi:uncharacterized protein